MLSRMERSSWFSRSGQSWYGQDKQPYRLAHDIAGSAYKLDTPNLIVSSALYKIQFESPLFFPLPKPFPLSPLTFPSAQEESNWPTNPEALSYPKISERVRCRLGQYRHLPCSVLEDALIIGLAYSKVALG